MPDWGFLSRLMDNALAHRIMSDWGFLSRLMDNALAHSTPIGKMWMVVLFLLRLFGAVGKLWNDKTSGFHCVILLAGCKDICYNLFYPISPMHYWKMEIIFVSVPTLIYLAHVTFITSQENKLREQLANPQLTNPIRRPRYTDEKGRVKIKGKLLCSYLLQLVGKILIEAASIWGQYYLYQFKVPFKYECNAENIPNHPCHGATKCYMPRPTEKVIFIYYMLMVASLSVLLNLLEVVCILRKQRCCKKRNRGRVVVEYTDSDSYNSHMLENLQNNDVILNMDGALVHRQGRHSV